MEYVDTFEFYLDDDEVITIGISYWYAGTPAFISGPPENCYPEDPPEFDWEVVGEERQLTDDQRSKIEDEIIERMTEEPDYPDYDD